MGAAVTAPSLVRVIRRFGPPPVLALAKDLVLARGPGVGLRLDLRRDGAGARTVEAEALVIGPEDPGVPGVEVVLDVEPLDAAPRARAAGWADAPGPAWWAT